MSKKGLLLVVIAVLIALVGVFAVSAQDAVEVELGEITQRVIDRGELICGVNQALEGFGLVNDAGEFEGFDVDFCRAVAAAILGDANAVSYRPLTGTERQHCYPEWRN